MDPQREGPLLRKLLTLPAASRRMKWIYLAVAIALLVPLGWLGSGFEGAQKNDPASFLPGSAESSKVLELADEFPSGELVPAIIVYRREGGLTAADERRIAADSAALTADLPRTALAPTPAQPSPDGTAAIVNLPFSDAADSTALIDGVDAIRDVVSADPSDGLEVAVTGPAGFSADAIKVFEGINGTLLLATAVLVFVLLIIIYRSPIFWFLPLVAVFFAEITVRAFGYLLAESGVIINGQTAGILLVLVFGAGTDYALLLVARYREELHRVADKHEAMRVALSQAGPTILASAGTVVAGLLCLALAEVNGTAGLGPIGAIGVAVAAITMLTVLPTLLLIFGRRAFWPFIPRYDGDAPDAATRGIWRRIGERVTTRPRATWIATSLALLALCAGLASFNTGLTSANGFRDSVEAVRGQELLAKSFPAGSTAPTSAIVRDSGKVDAARRAISAVEGVSALGPPQAGPPGVRFDVTLVPEPYSPAAYDLVSDIRDAVRSANVGEVLIGGPTAEEADLRDAATRDTWVLPPIVLVVVLVILILLLRSLVAPLLLVATVVLSFLASLGISVWLFNNVFDSPGQDPSLPLFGFIFLVALGVDYNIFLMARVREEALGYGTREAMLRGLAVTGAVITSAGIVLAGTFGVLGVLPLWSLFQIGFLVGLGVLIDTIIVRSVLVPALVSDLGGRTWWPSALARRTEP